MEFSNGCLSYYIRLPAWEGKVEQKLGPFIKVKYTYVEMPEEKRLPLVKLRKTLTMQEAMKRMEWLYYVYYRFVSISLPQYLANRKLDFPLREHPLGKRIQIELHMLFWLTPDPLYLPCIIRVQ